MFTNTARLATTKQLLISIILAEGSAKNFSSRFFLYDGEKKEQVTINEGLNKNEPVNDGENKKEQVNDGENDGENKKEQVNDGEKKGTSNQI